MLSEGVERYLALLKILDAHPKGVVAQEWWNISCHVWGIHENSYPEGTHCLAAHDENTGASELIALWIFDLEAVERFFQDVFTPEEWAFVHLKQIIGDSP